MECLSSNTLAICHAHYVEPGKRNGCGKCPIHSECTAPVEWSWAGFDKHNAALNRAAEAVVIRKDAA